MAAALSAQALEKLMCHEPYPAFQITLRLQQNRNLLEACSSPQAPAAVIWG